MPFFKHGFIRSEENVDLNNFIYNSIILYTHGSVSVNMCLINFDFDGRCYAIFIGGCYVLPNVIYVVVHGKPQKQMLLALFYQSGRCYCHSSV